MGRRIRRFDVVVCVAAFIIGVVGLTLARASASELNTGVSSTSHFKVPGSFPWGTAFDRLGRVWVAMPGCDPSTKCPDSTKPGKLGLFDPATNTWDVVVQLPSGYGQPLFVAVDQSGNVWFTMPVTNAIGVFDPDNDAIHQWAVPTPSAGPWDLAISRSGGIWFTEHYVNKIGEFDPKSDIFVREIATPDAGSNPYGVAIDASGNVWFTENAESVAMIGEYTKQGVLNEYKIRDILRAGTGLTPHMITVDRSGNIWWSEGWVHAIAKLDVAQAKPGTSDGITEYQYTPPCTTCGSHTAGIAVDSRGYIWFDDSLQGVLGSMPIGGGAFSFYKAPAANSHPYDGLNIDAQGRIWFDEEYANKLAEAIPSYSSGTGRLALGSKITIVSDDLVPQGAHLVTRATLRCLGRACSGSLRLTQTFTSTKTFIEKMTITKKTTVVIASAPYRIGAGKTSTVSLEPSATGMIALARARANSPIPLTLDAILRRGSETTKHVDVS